MIYRAPGISSVSGFTVKLGRWVLEARGEEARVKLGRWVLREESCGRAREVEGQGG